MRSAQVVELSFGARSGSGYLLTPKHVLTAKHVIDPAKEGAIGTVQALAPPGVDSLKLSRSKRPRPWPAHAAWISTTHDLAIVKLDTDPPTQIERLPFGRVPRDELMSYPCFGTGFPEAAGLYSHPIEAKLSWVLDDQRFNLDIAAALPKQWKKWAGISGAVIFASGLPVGVVRTVKGDWNGLLTATPVEHLIEDERFRKFWDDEGLGTLGSDVIRRESIPSAKLLDELLSLAKAGGAFRYAADFPKLPCARLSNASEVKASGVTICSLGSTNGSRTHGENSTNAPMRAKGLRLPGARRKCGSRKAGSRTLLLLS
jgi:hypothetical protein